jgi:hypothetical protein
MTDTAHLTAGDPLAAIRLQLVAAARGRIVRRRRRRRAALVVTLVLLLVAAGAAASELTGLSTGVPAVDRLLAVESGDGGRGLELRPGTGGASDPLPAPGLTGGKGGMALAYLSRAGRVCTAAAEDIGDRGVRGGFGGCYEPADLARRLERRGVVLTSMSGGPDDRTYSGYAAGDVVAVRLLLPGAPVEAKLTEPWTPRAPGGEPQRFFVGVDERNVDVGGDGVQEDEVALISPRPPRLELEYADGRVVEVKPGP